MTPGRAGEGQRSGTPPSDVGVSIYDEISLLRNVIF